MHRQRREPILFGQKDEFGIELEIVHSVDEWVLGRFLFWVKGTPIGDPEDESVHISHVGMSSFDKVTILLVEGQRGEQRCIFQQGDAEIMDAFFPPGTMQRVAADCVGWFSAQGVA